MSAPDGVVEATSVLHWPARAAEATGLGLGAAVVGATALFITPVLVAALAVDGPTPLFWTILIADLTLLFLFALATGRRPALFVGVLVLWFSVQRLAVALAAPHVEADTVRLLVTYKEGFYFILIASAALTFGRRLREGSPAPTPLMPADVLALALLVLLGVAFLVSSSDLSPKLTYGRRLAAPLLLYLGGRLLVPDRGQLMAALRLLVAVGLAVAAFGLVERFVLGTGFWRHTVDALTFYGKLAEGGLLPSDWVRSFQGVPEGIFSAFPVGVPVRRLVSTFLEPTTLGAFLAFVLLLVLFVPGLVAEKRGALWYGASLTLAVAIAATVSRGAMEIALIGGAGVVVAGFWQRNRLPPLRECALLAAIGVFLLASLLVTSLSFSQFPDRRAQIQDVLSVGVISGFPGYKAPPPDPNAIDVGVRTHVNGLSSGIEKMLQEPLGTGLGAAGGWSQAPEVGSESAVGTVAAQLGVLGLGLWAVFHLVLVASLAVCGLRERWAGDGVNAALLLTLSAALGGLTFTAIFSESASGLLGNAMYFLFAGWALAALVPAGRGRAFGENGEPG